MIYGLWQLGTVVSEPDIIITSQSFIPTQSKSPVVTLRKKLCLHCLVHVLSFRGISDCFHNKTQINLVPYGR